MTTTRTSPALLPPRVTETEFRGTPGVLLDLPGHRGRGIFIPGPHLDQIIDALDTIAAHQEDQ